MNISRLGANEPSGSQTAKSSPGEQRFEEAPLLAVGRRSNARRRLLSVSELEKIPDPAWLVEELLAEESLTVLFGPTGSYKTFLAIAFALSVATGESFGDRATKPGLVVYICAEGQAGIKWRIKAWRKAFGYEDPRIRVIAASVAFDDPDQVGELLYDLRSESEHPKLVVIDTLARTFGKGDESNSRDMNAYLHGIEQLIAELGTSVLIIHHSTKKLGDDPRGSSVLAAGADTVLRVERQSLFQAKLTIVKQRDGEADHSIDLVLEPVSLGSDTSGREKRSLVARMAGGTRRGAKR